MTTAEFNKWIGDNHAIAPKRDIDFWKKATSGLPGMEGLSGNRLDSLGLPMQPGTGPHCVRAFSDALILCRPSWVFEIGFNLGYGAAVMLALGVERVVSIDISERAETKEAAKILSQMHPLSFSLTITSSMDALNGFGELPGPTPFGMAFIDGDHSLEGVRTDIALCRKLGIKNMLFDDWFPWGGIGTQPEIKAAGLKLRCIMGNMVLCSEVEP